MPHNASVRLKNLKTFENKLGDVLKRQYNLGPLMMNVIFSYLIVII